MENIKNNLSNLQHMQIKHLKMNFKSNLNQIKIFNKYTKKKCSCFKNHKTMESNKITKIKTIKFMGNKN